jgi:hypothetical protein
MLPGYFIIVTFALRLLGSAAYIRAIIKGKARPNLLSWFLWSTTPIVAFVAAISSGVGISSFGTLALAASSVLVLIVALWRRAGVIAFDPATIACGLFAVLGIVLWQTTADPYFAISAAILADIASAIPTFRKIVRQPWTEYAPTYLLSAFAMVFALLTINDWSFASAAFPAYTLAVNVFAVTLILFFERKLRPM